MEVKVVKNQQEAADFVYDIIKAGVEEGKIQTLGLATGSSPLKLYQKMRQEKLDVSNVITVNLDEYVGLDTNHPQSYHYFMVEELFKDMNFKKNFLLNGVTEDLELECEKFEQILAENPIDLQVIGIGPNGHIAFNEPGTPFDSKTHVVQLTEDTRQANKRFFDKLEDVPTHAISMGIGSMMSAKQIIMLAFGEGKAEAVKKMIEGPVTVEVPASVLQTHPNTIIVIDEAAASKLSKETIA